jgi:hypothetical protein
MEVLNGFFIGTLLLTDYVMPKPLAPEEKREETLCKDADRRYRH